MIYLIIVLILIILVLFFTGVRKVVVYQSAKRKKVEESKKKVLQALEQGRGKITNDEVQKLLGVSDATAERYLNELEKQGKIKQIGKTGQSVYYEIV